MPKPTIGIIQGDACGIGPEILSKVLQDDRVQARADTLIVSDKRVFESGEAVAGNRTEIRVVEEVADIDFSHGIPHLLDAPVLNPETVALGKVSKIAGEAVLSNLALGLALARNCRIDGLCFMPNNKAALHAAGMDDPDGITWMKKQLDHQGRASEFNVVDGMWNARVTSHIPLKDVAGRLNKETIAEAIQLADQTLRRAGFNCPRIAVAALNPHAGDGGLMGREEIDIITPAIENTRSSGVDVDGPYPADTLYLKIRDKQYDCAVSMYHDQGQIALKLLGFDKGVTVLGGLPIPITTPAHGTAFDIAGRNLGNPRPAINAFMMVCKMVDNWRATNS